MKTNKQFQLKIYTNTNSSIETTHETSSEAMDRLQQFVNDGLNIKSWSVTDLSKNLGQSLVEKVLDAESKKEYFH